MGNRDNIRITDPGVAPEEKHITCQHVGFAVSRYFHIPDSLKRFTAQCPWCRFSLLRQGKMPEVDSVGIAILIRQTAYLLQNGKMMANGVYRISLVFHGECLIVMDELFRQLPECQILDLVLMFDELTECQAHIVITGISPFRPVNADTGFEVIADNLRHSHERHLRFHDALKMILHIGCIEINLTAHKIVKGVVHRQQKFINLGIGFHRLLALAVQTAFTGIPEFGSA